MAIAMSVENAKSAAPSRKRRRIPFWPVVLLWFLAMLPRSFWGLPTSSRDDLLFGGRPAWEADRYGAETQIAVRRSLPTGADTDIDPPTPTSIR